MSSSDGSGVRTPQHVIVMGVTASGKSTIAERLARTLGWSFGEGDSWHSDANIAKMASGAPLTDEDRAPWLDELARWVRAEHAAGRSTVLACSALKRAYRDRLRAAAPNIRFIHLDTRPAVLAQRLRSRQHFMPPELLESQLRDLEPLGPDERGFTVDAQRPPAALVTQITALLTGRKPDA